MKLLIIFMLATLSCTAQKIQWQGLNAGWTYENKFSKPLNSDYDINWFAVTKFSYQRWEARVQYTLPTFKYNFGRPYYILTLEFQILKPKSK